MSLVYSLTNKLKIPSYCRIDKKYTILNVEMKEGGKVTKIESVLKGIGFITVITSTKDRRIVQHGEY